MFNDAKSHIFKLENAVISSITNKGYDEELSSEFLEPDHDDLTDYFYQFKLLIETTLVSPLLESKAAVS